MPAVASKQYLARGLGFRQVMLIAVVIYVVGSLIGVLNLRRPSAGETV
jgi:hypothetical protein